MSVTNLNPRLATSPTPDDEPDIPILLGELYGVLHPDVDWTSSLQRLSKAFQCNAALLLTVDEASAQILQAEACGLSKAVLHTYRRHYANRDPLIASTLTKPLQACCDDLEKPRDEVDFGPWLRLSSGQRHRAAVMVTRPHAEAVCLMLMRQTDKKPFSQQYLTSLVALAPHLARAITLHENLEAMQSRWRAWHAMAAQSSQALMLVDAMGIVHEANDAAAKLLHSRDGLMLDNGRLNTRMPTDAAGLSNALQQAANAGEPTALAIHRKSGQSPYHAVLRPIGPTRQISASDACISVSISDPQRSCGVSPTQFKQLYKLSKREAELTGLLLDGATLSEAAERMGIAEATARTNLNRVYNKLGVRRQSELMRLFWGSVLDGITGLD